MQYTVSTDRELEEILQRSTESLIVKDALQQEQHYYQQVSADQNFLLQQNHDLFSHQTLELPALKTKVLAKIDQDLSYVQQLNQALAVGFEPGEGDLTWALKTNKMENILTEAKNLLTQDDTFNAIAQGQLPSGVDNVPPHPVILGDLTSIYGNSKVTYLSTAILEVNLSLHEGNFQVQDIVSPDDALNWIDQSAMTHVTPIPSEIHPNQIASDFTDQFSFYFSDDLTPQGFAFVHSGYAFGGQRLEDRYADGKALGPEDCSSWIAKLAQAETEFSTIDQLYTYRMGLPEESRGFIDPDWHSTQYAKTQNVLSPVVVKDVNDIHPGQVFAFRDFDSADHLNSSGVSGHTALVLGMRENGNVVTLGYARGMPQFEGFGIKEFYWNSTDTRETMFFDIKSKPLLLEDVLCHESSVPGLDSASMTTAVQLNTDNTLVAATLVAPAVPEMVIEPNATAFV